jgi:DUF4097 and DUF4098 domain-containing protein YvlB
MKPRVTKALIRAGQSVLAAAFLLTPVLLPAAPALAVEKEDTTTRTIPAPSSVRLEVSNESGDTIVRSWARPEIRLEVVKVARARSEERAVELLGKLDFSVEENGDLVKVIASYPHRETAGVSLLGLFISPGERARVDFQLDVPRGARVKAGSASGDVEVLGVAGPVNVDVTSGDVRVTDVAGEVTLDATSGDVELIAVGGAVRIQTTSGDVTLTDVKGRVVVGATSGEVMGSGLTGGGELIAMSGDIEITSSRGAFSVTNASGDVTFDRHDGPLTVKTSSGDVIALVTRLAGEGCRLDASSGSVTLEVPQGTACRLALSTGSGAIHARLPLDIQEVRRNRLAGLVRGGGPLVEITTASGDIDLAEAEETRP